MHARQFNEKTDIFSVLVDCIDKYILMNSESIIFRLYFWL